MRIVIDMQGAQSEASGGRGVGRYTRELTKGLIRAYGDSAEVFLALNGKLECKKILDEFEDILPRKNIKTWYYHPDVLPAGLVDNNRVHPEELFREWYLHQFNADVIWNPNLQEGYGEPNIATSTKITKGNEIVISTLHDVIPLIYEQDYLNAQVKPWYLKKIKYACDSDLIITDSIFSKNKIIELLEVNDKKIEYIHLGYDKKQFFSNKDYLTFDTKEPFFLYVGGADQHKNLFRLIEAFSKLDNSIKKRYKLVFAGKETLACKDEYIEHAVECGLSARNIEFTGRISDEELIDKLQKCAAFVFPSYSEGFGLPPLEAMACGAPTLAARAASLTEILNDEEASFDPFNIDELAEKMNRVVTDEVFTNNLITRQLARANEFSWEKAGKQFKEIIDRLVAGRKLASSNAMTLYSELQLCDDILDVLVNDTCEEKAKIAYSIVDSKIFDSKRRIYVDTSAVVLEDYVSGIQRVVNGIAINLCKMFEKRRDIEVKAVYSDPSSPHFYISDFNGKKYIKRKTLNNESIAQFKDGDIFIMPDLHPSNIIAKSSMLQRLARRGINVYTVLHDIIPMQYPEFFSKQFVKEYKDYLKAIAQFSGIIAVSAATMNAYKTWCKKEKVEFPSYFVLNYNHSGADIEKANPSKGLPEDASILLRKMKNSQTVLMVGTIEPRKKQELVLAAMEHIWLSGADVNLVFVGRNGWQMEEFVAEMEKHKEYGKRLFWLSGISDEYLELIYEHASGVLIASLEEGFGLPIIESAKKGKPILLRDIPVFKEVAENNAYYFSGNDTKELSAVIEKWLDLIKKDEAPKSANIKYYTWEESVRLLIQKIDADILSEECVYTQERMVIKDKWSTIDYLDFENAFRGSEELIAKRQIQYLPYFRNCKKVLDIGCGRGEFLKLLKANNIDAEGVDLYEECVEKCRREGLKVICGDGIKYLKSQYGWDGIFAAQLIEHLSLEQIITLCTEAYHRLDVGAYLILETPNPTKLGTFTNAFYMDPTHQKPVHPATMKYLLEKIGFKDVEIIFTKESEYGYTIPMIESSEINNLEAFNHGMTVLNDLIFGSMDYAVIGRK